MKSLTELCSLERAYIRYLIYFKTSFAHIFFITYSNFSIRQSSRLFNTFRLFFSVGAFQKLLRTSSTFVNFFCYFLLISFLSQDLSFQNGTDKDSSSLFLDDTPCLCVFREK